MNARLTLLKWLVVPLCGINLVGAAAITWMAWTPTQLAFDQSLTNAVWALIPQLRDINGGIEVDLPKQARLVLRAVHTDEIYFVVRDESARTVAGDDDFPLLLAKTQPNEVSEYDGMMRGDRVRVAALRTTVGSKLAYVGVAETMHQRNQVLSRIIWNVIALEAALMLASVALIWLLAGRGTLSHQKLKMTVAETSLESLLAFDRNRDAKESNPFFNALLSHVQFAMRVQQEFLVNMARRFTTSIGEIKEQLDKLDQHQSASRVSGEIALRMRDCVDNMSRQADQLAVLARAEPSLFDRTQSQVVNLDGLIGEVLQTYSEQAKSRQIELKFDLEPVLVFGDRTLLRDMLDNLLDNAIRYSAIGGKVIVTCDAERGAVVLRVEDSGPGFPESERRILFDRLLPSGNIVGAGLGLAIIRDIAKAHGANIVLQQAAGGMGSVVLVNFPQDG